MIKEENIIQETTTKIIYRFCDDCNAPLKPIRSDGSICNICGRDLCHQCIGHEDYSGDYSYVYCKSCWTTIGGKYRNEILGLENQIDLLTDEWHLKCNNNRIKI